ncbi:LemA family protein [Porphyromonas endodontalis]|uniref:LemA family protein n=1 Tax=Porphyromonas endodontalis (strain ATCC 35406 / DSM 24491 / JCM 8526 / CCUG 16442 / BCRC 14492 / NCTC 13058 / HG 370) TaxID=553175 RepID=C3JAD6_POREA|nr:LemA family protein [Porphyromonas endodontalis]EEN82628.1 LemA family protein [Porphyromonas endodontalis ATCC 35406]UBH65039.1 LemA family protein [Porphyromonas endodontalis]SUB68358.1 LemA family [Porphyromonas endodontalis]
MTKNKKPLILIGIVALIILIGGWLMKGYNGMVNEDENVNLQWGEVENQYQRRLDLIPNLVNVVKGYASHEKEALEGVIEARAKATQTTIDPSNMTEEQLANFQKAQDGLSGALNRLMVVVEKYPELKANENFLQLQAQLEGTENRITVARKSYNDAATIYNKLVRRFPNNMLAGIFGFSVRPQFKAQEGAESAPAVQF